MFGKYGPGIAADTFSGSTGNSPTTIDLGRFQELFVTDDGPRGAAEVSVRRPSNKSDSIQGGVK
jgi:hypothetical protein